MHENNPDGGKPKRHLLNNSDDGIDNVGTGLAPVLHPSDQPSPVLHPSPIQANTDLQPFFEGLRQLCIELTDEQLNQFLRYQQELLDWNTRMNLTSITNNEEVLTKHFLDSLSLLMAYDAPLAHVLDIGSGAGFPGLPLKILRPQWHVVLLEATGKKVTFMRHIIETLHLHNVKAVHGRAEELAHKADYRASFDLVTARAVASIPTLLEYATPFTRSGGTMIFPKKGDLTGELARGKRAASQLGARFRDDILVTLPGLDDGRRLLVWEQVSKCPEQYPRSGSLMAKKPLVHERLNKSVVE